MATQGNGDNIPNRVPPHSIYAESCVLGSMILNSAAIDIVVQIVEPSYFYTPAHQSIYQAIVDMRQANKPIDLVTLREELAQRKILEEIGKVEYLVSLVDGLPDAGNAEYYAHIVRDKALLRELILAGNEMIREAYDSSDEASKIIDSAENSVFQIAQKKIGQESVGLSSLLQQTFEDLEAHEGKLITGLATGYTQLDEMTSGFQQGEMIILAARPSMGKTSILLNLGEFMAVVDHKPVAIFSLEMSNTQLAQRFLASHARFDLRQMRRASITSDDWTKLQYAAGELEQAPIFVDDTPVLTILQLRAKARRLKAAHDIQCIYLDYLQLMSYGGPSSVPRHEQITEISRGIKALARELSVPIVCAAQLNRGPTDRESHRPRMSDLRESGSIEQDADVIMLLHNEDYYHIGQENYLPTNITELIIAKQRNGPTGVVKLVFLKDITRFESAAPGSYEMDA